ncbi:MAG: Gfo/Idh/MocA family oxidoreductase [Candidatus Omnitrophica bacterium]|nr:Gfo/Idh/MocA family oxidoreductase [Candidatus Omnitrophota bacterium]MCM8802087.1 Gfo/Idh/MocA family oxidoreductase [Candidatus Omnitrophota bacterium]
MNKKIKIGIIGAGGRANFQAKSILESNIGEPVIVYSPFEEEVKNFSEKYQIKYTTSLEEILYNPEIEAITISTPNATHYEITKKGLENNKNILVEYPPTLKIEQLDELINLAKEKRLVYWVSLTQLLENPHYTIKKNLNLLERPLFYYLSYISSSLSGWYSQISLSGPIYLWQHFHFVSQLLDLFKDPEEISVFENIEYSSEGVMSSTFSVMNIKFGSGLLSTIEFGMGIKDVSDTRIKLLGDGGFFYYERGRLYFINKKEGKKEIEMEKVNIEIDTFNFLKEVSKVETNVERAIEARKILKICLCAEVSAKEKNIVKVKDF